MPELNDIDYEILVYIYKHEPVHIDKLKSKFHDVSSIENRLPPLLANKAGMFGTMANTSLITEDMSDTERDEYNRPKGTGVYRITDLGKITAEDYIRNKKLHNRELWLTNVKMPIIVSFVTTMITLALTNWLSPMLPQILQWLCDVFSKNPPQP